MITEAHALEIWSEARTSNAPAHVCLSNSDFTRALNLAAAMALDELADTWGNSEDIAVMQDVISRYREAAKGPT